jgi:hypothetical protein
MHDPILQDHRQEHVQFQKLALLLLERVTGKPSCDKQEASLINIHNVNKLALI